MYMKRRTRLISAILVLVLWGVFFTVHAASPTEWVPTLTVSFLDVDQGDATLFQGPDFTILVDAGRHDRSDVVPLLRAAGVDSLDLFVLTHPHSDHIGQCDGVMEAFSVKEVWMSGDLHTSRTFERCVDAVLASEAFYHEPRAGEKFQIGSAQIEIVHPERVTGDFNNGSIGFRLVYGDVAFLLTGDAEAKGEEAMLAGGHDLAADILHLGHHGSSTSSTLPFLRAVDPDIAVYSAGAGNSYGHPHREVVQRLAALAIPLYGTDIHGTVVIATDGTTWQVYTGSDAPRTTPMESSVTLQCQPGQININRAALSELTRIVHIGSVIGQRIIDGRPYFSLEDLLNVSGIGASRLAEIKAQGLACAGPFN